MVGKLMYEFGFVSSLPWEMASRKLKYEDSQSKRIVLAGVGVMSEGLEWHIKGTADDIVLLYEGPKYWQLVCKP
jgi:hypothetical protein